MFAFACDKRIQLYIVDCEYVEKKTRRIERKKNARRKLNYSLFLEDETEYSNLLAVNELKNKSSKRFLNVT